MSIHQIQVGKTYKDVIGRDVRIVATDAKHIDGPILGLVKVDGGGELPEIYQDDGRRRHGTAHLVLPRKYVAVDDLKSLIRAEVRVSNIREDEADQVFLMLDTMNGRELADA